MDRQLFIECRNHDANTLLFVHNELLTVDDGWVIKKEAGLRHNWADLKGAYRDASECGLKGVTQSKRVNLGIGGVFAVDDLSGIHTRTDVFGKPV
ncbi:hypothetical protein GCM10022277_28080 [Litoribacillus peritrichatus]|uniref:Uncharacterized protein n=1 Tax=Litoribacillus peritrichatus TaxID=718191 RepID=A0ABP7MTF4_9GAMM